VLVATVLRPEQREDGELEAIRLASEQVRDPVELAVAEPQSAVQPLFRDRRQSAAV
jgi:hypothetical protein